MSSSRAYYIGAWVLLGVATLAGVLGSPDARVDSGYVIACIAFATSDILKALGK